MKNRYMGTLKNTIKASFSKGAFLFVQYTLMTFKSCGNYHLDASDIKGILSAVTPHIKTQAKKGRLYGIFKRIAW